MSGEAQPLDTIFAHLSQHAAQARLLVCERELARRCVHLVQIVLGFLLGLHSRPRLDIFAIQILLRSQYTIPFFCVCSLLNKPTVPKYGTHHTAAVERKTLNSEKEPPSPPPPPPSVTRIPDAELVPQLYSGKPPHG